MLKRSPNSAKKRTTRTQRPRRKASNQRITPVAIKNSSTSSQAVIPVVVKGTPDSSKAVISVEVSGAGKAPRRRAAVIPITVKTKNTDQQRTAEARNADSARNNGPVRWSDPLTDWVVKATYAGESAITILGAAGLTTVDMFENVFRMLFDPERGSVARSERMLPIRQSALVESFPILRSEPRAA